MTKNCTTSPQNTSVGCHIILFHRRTAKEVPCSPHCQSNTPPASASISSAHIHPGHASRQLLTSHISWFLGRQPHMSGYNPAYHCHPKLPCQDLQQSRIPASTSSRIFPSCSGHSQKAETEPRLCKMEHVIGGKEGRQLFEQVISIPLRKQVVKMIEINWLIEQPQKCFQEEASR